MKRLKEYLRKRKLTLRAKEVGSELEQLVSLGRYRVSAAGTDPYRTYTDGLKESEARRYRELASEHYDLCGELGMTSQYFRPAYEGGQALGEDSPPAFLTVIANTSTIITMGEYDYKAGGRWRYINGVKDDGTREVPVYEPDGHTRKKKFGKYVTETINPGLYKSPPPQEEVN